MSTQGAKTAKITRFPVAPSDPALREKLKSIARENFSRSDLVRARKMASGKGMSFVNDFDAIRQLRNAGHDMRPSLPKSSRFPSLVPADALDDQDEHEARSALRRLGLRLGLFVAVPTACAAIYYGAIATPVYATYSEFVIQKPDITTSGQSQNGSSLAGNQDAISVQGFMTSRAAFEALDDMEGFRAHFSDPSIDVLQRLSADASSEEAYRMFRRHIDVAFDPTEGVLRMRVEAMDPQISRDMSLTLISLAEEHLDRMSSNLRRDQVASALEARDRAAADVEEIRNLLIRKQEEYAVLSGDLEMDIIQEQINKLETELTESMIEYQELQFNLRPNQARIDNLESRIEMLRENIAEKRKRIAEANADGVSIARAKSELSILEAELKSRQEVKTESILALQRAQTEANRQNRYLSLGVEPMKPGAPETPRPFLDTMKAFAVFLGLYLFGSLTLNLIRDHVFRK